MSSTLPYRKLAHWAVHEAGVPTYCAEDACGAAYEGIARSLDTYTDDHDTTLETWAMTSAFHHVRQWKREWFHTRHKTGDWDVEMLSGTMEPWLFDVAVDDCTDEIVSTVAIEALLAVPELTDLERDVLRRIYLDRESLISIGSAYSVSSSRIVQIRTQSFRKLRSHRRAQLRGALWI